MQKRKKLAARFWDKVEKGSECWTWTASIQNKGYGQIRVKGRALSAHRVAWELTHGPIPDGLCVLHKCDNRACVRPDHLFLGTFSDNSRDAYDKGRARAKRGEDNVNAKLIVQQVKEIRLSNLSTRQLAKQYKVSHTTILAVRREERYIGTKYEPDIQ